MFKNRLHLLARDTWKPFQELIDCGSALEVFEKGSNGNTGLSKHPGATQLFGRAFDRGTGDPIQHGTTVFLCPGKASAASEGANDKDRITNVRAMASWRGGSPPSVRGLCALVLQ